MSWGTAGAAGGRWTAQGWEEGRAARPSRGVFASAVGFVKTWGLWSLTLCFILGVSGLYLDELLHGWPPGLPKTTRLAHVVCYGLLALPCLYSFMFASMWPPPTPPAGGQSRAVREAQQRAWAPLLESKKNGCRRYCRRCRAFKPDRTHHCYDCGTCVLKMDHHCVFLNACVHHGNHKHFLLFLLYAVLSCAFVAYSVLAQHGPSVNDVLRRRPRPYPTCGGLLLISLVFVFALGMFLAFQLFLLARGQTTIEYMEGKGGRHYSSRTSAWWNVRQALGPNPLLWLVPTSLGVPGNGLSWALPPEHKKTV